MAELRTAHLREYYTRAITVSRAGKLSLALFTVFFVIACGSKDGMHAMMKLFGSLFGAPEVSNPEQFFKWAPLVYFGYSLVICALYARRLALRADWYKEYHTDSAKRPDNADWLADVSGYPGARAARFGFYARLAANAAFTLLIIIALAFNVYNMLVVGAPGGRVGSSAAVAGMRATFIPQVLGFIVYVLWFVLLLLWDLRTGAQGIHASSRTQRSAAEPRSPRRRGLRCQGPRSRASGSTTGTESLAPCQHP